MLAIPGDAVYLMDRVAFWDRQQAGSYRGVSGGFAQRGMLWVEGQYGE